MSTMMSDATPVPDSPTSDRDLSMSQHHQFTPLPVLEATNTYLQDDHLAGGTDIDRSPAFFRQSTTCSFSFSCADSIRTIFFVTDQTDMGGQSNRSLTIELDPMYLIEKDNNDSDSIEKLKYSSIKLVPAEERYSENQIDCFDQALSFNISDIRNSSNLHSNGSVVTKSDVSMHSIRFPIKELVR